MSIQEDVQYMFNELKVRSICLVGDKETDKKAYARMNFEVIKRQTTISHLFDIKQPLIIEKLWK